MDDGGLWNNWHWEIYGKCVIWNFTADSVVGNGSVVEAMGLQIALTHEDSSRRS